MNKLRAATWLPVVVWCTSGVPTSVEVRSLPIVRRKQRRIDYLRFGPLRNIMQALAIKLVHDPLMYSVARL